LYGGGARYNLATAQQLHLMLNHERDVFRVVNSDSRPVCMRYAANPVVVDAREIVSVEPPRPEPVLSD